MSISSAVQKVLYADATVKASVDTWVESATTYYAIFSGTLLPDKVKTDSGNIKLDVKNKTINHYLAGNISGGSVVINVSYSISCRAYNESDALAIQSACYDALNRVRSDDGKYFFVASKLPVIPKRDDNDNFNAPVELNIKGPNC